MSASQNLLPISVIENRNDARDKVVVVIGLPFFAVLLWLDGIKDVVHHQTDAANGLGYRRIVTRSRVLLASDDGHLQQKPHLPTMKERPVPLLPIPEPSIQARDQVI